MSYPDLLQILLNFGLITEEQAKDALAEYTAAMDHRLEYMREWHKRVPWWKRFNRSWVKDYYAELGT